MSLVHKDLVIFLSPARPIKRDELRSQPTSPPSMTSYSAKFPKPRATILEIREYTPPHPHSGVIFGKIFLGLGKIQSSAIHIGCGTWKDSGIWPIYRVWDLQKFLALPLYRFRGTGKNSVLEKFWPLAII